MKIGTKTACYWMFLLFLIYYRVMKDGPKELLSLVQKVAEGLSNFPNEVKAEIEDTGDGEHCIVITCRNNNPNDTDLGLIIGKQGRNIKALRTLADSVAAKHKMRITLIVK
jgi:predicted RNA-binding protein YlqC (UPF0109 family)